LESIGLEIDPHRAVRAPAYLAEVPRFKHFGGLEDGGDVGLNVLVVEDDADARFVLADLFRGVGCVVREAEHGQHALDVLLIERWRPNVIVLDVAMPVMDGLTFLAKKREADLPAIPVIVVSATARAPIADASCVLSKPVDPQILLDAVLQHAA
jgi:CheY-like chemotaxis protein